MELTKKLEFINQELELENSILKEKLVERDNTINRLKKEKEDQIHRNEEVIDINKKLQSELDSILYSRSYKFMQSIKKIVGRR